MGSKSRFMLNKPSEDMCHLLPHMLFWIKKIVSQSSRLKILFYYAAVIFPSRWLEKGLRDSENTYEIEAS